MTRRVFREEEGAEGPGGADPAQGAEPAGGGGADPGGEAQDWNALPEWARTERTRWQEREQHLTGEARRAYVARDERAQAERELRDRLGKIEERFAPPKKEGPDLAEYPSDWDEPTRKLVTTAEERAYQRALHDYEQRTSKDILPAIEGLKKESADRAHRETVERVQGYIAKFSGTDDEPGEFPLIDPFTAASVIGALDNGRRSEEDLIHDARKAFGDISKRVEKRVEAQRKTRDKAEADAARAKLAARKPGTMRGGGVPAPPEKGTPWDSSRNARRTRLVGAIRGATHPAGR